MATSVYQQGGYGTAALFPSPVIAQRNPATTDTVSPTGQPYQILQGWNNELTDDNFLYLGSGNWVEVASIAGSVNELAGNSGSASPLGGIINVVGSGTIQTVGAGSTLTISSTASGFPITPYVVGPVGKAGYQTVQAAITAANAAGGGAIYVQPGTYTENLTLFDKITIVGTDPLKSIITGVHTPPAAGTVTFENIVLTSATSIFSSVAAGSTNITLVTCVCSVTNGYVFDLLNWTGTLFFYGCGATGTTDGGVNNTGGATVIINDSTVGAGAGAMTASAGTVTIQSSRLNCTATFGAAAIVTSVNSYFTGTLTFSGTATGTFYNGTFVTGATAAISQGSTNAVTLAQATINSSANPVIAGAGTGGVTLGDIEFLSNSAISTSFVTTYAKETGRISPYVVGASGNYPSIQAAINELKPQFGPHVIYLQPGALYTESLDFTGFTFACNVVIRATSLFAQSTVDGAAIIGNHIPPDSGQIFFENLNLIASAGSVFTSAAAGASMIWLRNCNATTTAGGYLFDLLNWAPTGRLVLENYRASASGIANSIINNTGGCTLQILDSTFVGTATGLTSTISGPTLIRNSVIYCPLDFVTGSTLDIYGSTFNNTVTLSNNSTGIIENSYFSTGAAAAITMSSSGTIRLANSIISSTNNPSIAGAGAGILTIGDVTFTNNALLAGTLTVAYASISGALATTNAPGASPQIVNARTGQVAFTDSIANGAYGTLTLTDSVIAAGSIVIASVSCTTVNSACQIVETTPGAGSVAFRIFNAGAAATAANILVNFWVIN